MEKETDPRQLSLVSRSSSYRKRRIGNLAKAPLPATVGIQKLDFNKKEISSLVQYRFYRWFVEGEHIMQVRF